MAVSKRLRYEILRRDDNIKEQVHFFDWGFASGKAWVSGGQRALEHVVDGRPLPKVWKKVAD